MWTYKNITREEFEIKKDQVESIMVSYGAQPTPYCITNSVATIRIDVVESFISKRKVYEYHNNFFRVDEVLFADKPFIVIEWADSIEKVMNNMMEDTDPFPHDLSDDKIGEEVKFILK